MVSVRSRAILILLFAVGLWTILWVEMGRWGGGILRLPLPIARGHGLPVPILYWAGVLLYSQVYGTLFHLPRTQRWTRALCLGFGLHAVSLIAALPGWSAANSQELVGLSLWYVRYWQAVWVLMIALGGAVLWTVVSTDWRSWMADPFLFFIPLVGGYLALWGSARTMSPVITLAAVALTIGCAVAWRLEVIRRRGAQLVEWLGRERVFCAAVFLIALAFRLFYMTRILSSPDFLNTGSDGPVYDRLAWSLLHGEETPLSRLTLFAPGYVRFLAAIYWLVGRNYVVVCAVQALLGAWACLLLYAVAKRLFDTTVARIAAVFAALNFPMIFAAAAIGHQAMDLFWTLLVVWCLVRYLDDPTRWGRWVGVIGLLLGWAAVTREGNLMVWVFLLGWFLVGVRRRLGWPTALRHALVLSLGVLVVLLPFIWGGGIVDRLSHIWFYYEHTSPHINAWFNPWRNPEAAWALFQGQPLNVMVKVGEAMLGNFTAMFLHQDYGSFDPVFLVRGSPYYYGMWFYALSLAFFGLGVVCWGAFRRPVERLDWWLIIILLASRTAVHLVLASAYRYRVPLEPYLIMLAAVGCTQLLRRPATEDATSPA